MPGRSSLKFEAIPYIVLLGFLYGTSLVASRFSVGQYAPTTYISLRLVLAGLGHAVVYLVGRRAWPRSKRLWKHAAMLGVLGTSVPMTAIVSSLQYLSSGVASVLVTANPAVTVLFAHFLLSDERLNSRKAFGVALALGGALLLALRGESGLPDVSRAAPIGYVLMGILMVSASAMVIYARKFMSDLDAFDVASVRMWTAAMTVTPLSLLFVGFDLSRVDQQGVFVLIYASVVGTFFGMMTEFYTIKRFGATAAVLSSYVIPVFASLGGALFLGETITVGMLGGMLLIGVGLLFINRG